MVEIMETELVVCDELVICDHTIMLGCKECHHSEEHVHSSECDFICPILEGLSMCIEIETGIEIDTEKYR